MKKLTTLAAVLALLSVAPAQAMQDAGQTGEYDRDETTGGGGGGGSVLDRFRDGIRDLLDLGSGGRNAPKKGKGNPKRLDNSRPFGVDRGNNRGNGSHASPTRGGAYD